MAAAAPARGGGLIVSLSHSALATLPAEPTPAADTEHCSFLHRLPAHVKIVSVIAFLLVAVSTPAGVWPALPAYALLLAACLIVAAVPAKLIAQGALVEVPFLIYAVALPLTAPGPRTVWLGLSLSAPGLQAAALLLVKASLGAGGAILLRATTDTPAVLAGLARLRLPALLVTIAAFMLRYGEVVAADARRMAIARAARGHKPRGPRAWGALGAAAGTLFIRSYERGERVHLAMLARGYAGSAVHAADRASLHHWLTGLVLPGSAVAIALTTWVVWT